jgi:hypothetical protein
MSLPALATMVAIDSKLKKQSLNVFENKGPEWKTSGLSLYVYENKHTYPAKARMSLKIKVVILSLGLGTTR